MGFKAYPPNHAGSAPPWVKITMVCADCILIAVSPVLVQLSKGSDGQFAYNPVSVNFFVELTKTACALCVLLVLGTGRPGPPMTRSPSAFVRDALHCRALLVPASLYALNNYLKFVMQLFFKPTSAKMIGNLKVLTIAVLMKAVMGRSFTVMQWEALLLLVAGITVNQLSDCAGGAPDPAAFSPPALVATLGTVTIPAAASVYNEAALKRDMETSVHLQNFFLYFFGLLFNAAALCLWLVAGGRGPGALVAGFNKWAVLLVINNAAQGTLASFFFKFADTILKKYSSTLATIVTGVLSALLFAHPLTLNFAVGISIVFISMHQFFTAGEPAAAAKRQAKFDASPSMDHLLLESAASEGSLPSRSVSGRLPSDARRWVLPQ